MVFIGHRPPLIDVCMVAMEVVAAVTTLATTSARRRHCLKVFTARELAS